MTLNIINNLYKNTKKSYIIISLILELFTIITLINNLIKGNYHNAILCLLTIVLSNIPLLIINKYKIIIPNLINILYLIFIFGSFVMGEVYNFFCNIFFFDIIVHIISGFLCSYCGLIIINKRNVSNKIILLFVLCFSITIGVFWELFEYSMDKFRHTDMQKDTIVNRISITSLDNCNVIDVSNIDHTILYNSNNKELMVINEGYLDIGIIDTMEDLLSDIMGSIVFLILWYFKNIM